jgi:hypothetical protein
MANPSALPLRLQVINRIVTVLGAITAGTDYWFTPAKVAKKFLTPEEAVGFPCYMVMAGEKGNRIELAGSPKVYDEFFTVSVKGIIKNSSDTVTDCEKALRDIRKAINDDSISGTSGTLGNMTGVVAIRIDQGPDMDDGSWSINGYGFFDQPISVHITGDYGEL